KYIKISKSGTTNKIGNSALTAISIVSVFTQLAKANPVPACAEAITQAIPFAKYWTPAFPQGKYIKNHVKNKLITTNIPVEFHCMYEDLLEKSTTITKNTINRIMSSDKNIIHPPCLNEINN